MIANPIIRKEVLSSLRTRKAVSMQALFVLVVAALVALLWPAGGLQDLGGQQAWRIVSVLAVGQLVMVILFAPAFTAASLTSEKERGTLESLFATTMKPWEIALGKMVGSLCFLLLLVLSGVPALCLPFMLGGVPGGAVLAVLGILVTTAIYLGMIGLLISSVMHRSYRAIIVTYAVLGAVCFLAALPAWPVSRNLITRFGPMGQAFLHVIASLSPLEAMLSVVWPGSAYAQGAAGMPPFWQVFLMVAALVIVATTVACLIRLRRPSPPPRPREKLKIVERGQISARTFLFIVDPRKRKRMIRWWQNPVLIKEFRTRPMLQAQWLLRAVGICLVIAMVLMIVETIGVQAFVAEGQNMIQMMAAAVGAMMVVLIVLVGPAVASGAICSDRETGVWDLLRATPLPSWRIASGKFQASVIPLLMLALATMPALLLLLYFNVNLWPNMVRIAYVVGMSILFVATAGMFFSSLFSRTSTATAWTYALVVSMALVTLLVLLGRDLFREDFKRAVFVFNPVVVAMEAAGDARMQYGLLYDHLRLMAIATAAMFVVTTARVFQLRRAT
jgi:ABC-type transport system involved in multi-copper enzyme maturation permease subunit